MTLRSCLSLLSASLLAVCAAAADTAVAIRHDPVGCIVAERFTKLEAGFDPADQLARGRVYFRADGGPYWYYVELKAEAGTFYGVLPKVKKTVKKVDYYVDAMDRAFAEGRSAEYGPAVVEDRGVCSDKLVAAILPGAKIVLGAPKGAPPIPFGFEAAGIETGSATSDAQATSAAPGESAHKGHGKKIGLIALAAVGGGLVIAAGGVSGYVPPSEASSPTAGIASITPSGTALVGATTLTFTATASAGGASFEWDFGDGTSASGATATHVYAQEGSFAVVLRATGSGSSATASANVSARSLAGHWVDDGPPQESDDLTQSGANVAGTNNVGSNHRPLSGTVSNPRAVTWTRFDSGQPDERLTLTANDTITQLTGTVTKIRDGSQKAVVLNRR